MSYKAGVVGAYVGGGFKQNYWQRFDWVLTSIRGYKIQEFKNAQDDIQKANIH